MKKQLQCPNCHFYKVEPRWARMVGFGAWITLVGFPLCLLLIGFIFIPIGILMMLYGWLFLKGYHCINCGWTGAAVE